MAARALLAVSALGLGSNSDAASYWLCDLGQLGNLSEAQFLHL